MKLDKQTMKKLMFLITFTIVLFFALTHIDTVINGVGFVIGLISPLLFGFGIAFVLNVPLRYIESRLFFSKNKVVQKIKRPVSILLSIIIILLFITAVLLLVIPEVIKTFNILIDLIPDFFEKIKIKATEYYNEYPEIKTIVDSITKNRESLSDTIMNFVQTGAGNIIGTTFGFLTTLFGGIVNFVVALIFGIYILGSKEKLKSQVVRVCRAWFPERPTTKVFHVFSVANEVFRKFVVGQVTEAFILGTLCTIGMMIFKFPYSGMVGALVGMTALIPIVGAFIGAGVGAFMIMMEDPIQAILFLVFIIVLQQLEGNVIYPKVVGSSVGLPAMWVLAAVTVGGGAMGIPGMLLGVPVASTIYTLARENVHSHYDKKSERREKIRKILEQANINRAENEKPDSSETSAAVKTKSHAEKTDNSGS